MIQPGWRTSVKIIKITVTDYRFIFSQQGLSLVAFFLLLSSGLATAASLPSSNKQVQDIQRSAYYQVPMATTLSVDEAQDLYDSGGFTTSALPLNLGIGARPVWLGFEFTNPIGTDLSKRLSIKNSWLDELDVYFVHGGQVESHHAGDSLAFSQRATKSRYFVFDHDFPAGITRVFIRAASPDPMLLPIYLQDINKAGGEQTVENYSYGFIYGGMFTLLAYNLMLFFSLKNARYLFYSVYVTAFLATNIAYTGHGFMWLWPESLVWQQWSNPVLMMLYAVTGLLFAAQFLNTKQNLPKLHRLIRLICIGFLLAQCASVAVGAQISALLLSFSFVFIFSVLMVLLGAVAYLKGNQSAKYFLIGSIAHVTGACVTAMVVWGFMPYSVLSYRAVELGSMADAILLAMALADKFRIVQEEKQIAESLSNLDPLTEINNRRAFYNIVNPVWDVGLRKSRPMSVILLDIDRFKRINDRYGHTQGDEILVLIANALGEEIRTGDCLARWGGEEFIIFLPETPGETARIIAERLREKVSVMSLPSKLDNMALTVSLGAAENDQGNLSLDALISAADKYLYRAKDGGRNQVCGGLFSEAPANKVLNKAES
ncbi:MAG: GGDEF domain-containing protein [Gammaproteobacteria bacterium]|nr:GGDEF domain-containing protein [Gammaproteobacteria bacterium]MBQ0838757.1 GGDEF domain-containing protein [Gammaproteobacteria bacterium]